MEWRFALPGSTTAACRLEKSMWLGQLRLWHQGKEIARSNEQGKPFLIPNAATGKPVRVQVKGGGLDVPSIDVDGVQVLLGRPLSTLEYVVGGIPLVLVFLGGAIGGASGAVGAMFNYRVLREAKSTSTKVLGVLGVSALSFLTYVVLASIAQTLLKR
jgi:hypothetical protein